jgi:hypothetical protein
VSTATTSNRTQRRKNIAEFKALRQDRRNYHARIAKALNDGSLGLASHDTAATRALLDQLGGGAQGYAASGFPQAAGGVDVSAALTSVRPGIRKIKKLITQVSVVPGQTTVTIPFPKSGYLERPIIRIEGNFNLIQGATAQAMTMNDLRSLIQRIRFELSSTVVPKAMSGLACDVIDNLDVAVVSANANVVPSSGALSGIANSNTTVPFVLELSPRLTISDQNLYGIPYLGAISTVPQIVIDFAPLVGAAGASPISQAAAGPTVTLTNTVVKVDGWRIDLPAPVAPSATTDAQGNVTQVAGEGLWAESSYLLKTNLIDSQDTVTASLQRQFRIPIGPMYSRIILLAYVGGVLDPETAAPNSILDHTELGVQQVTTIESRAPWQFNSDYRNAYYKTRPPGVYVHSGIDQSGTDEDLWVTQDLGDFILTAFTTPNANGAAGTKYECYGQGLMPISAPGLYA